MNADLALLTAAIDLSRMSPPHPGHYAVGAVIAAADGTVLSTGYTAEGDPHHHAEEAALAKLPPGLDLSDATVFSSLEPCTTRRSRPSSCTSLIVTAGLRRVVFALREPLYFADCDGVALLRAAGVEVVEIPSLGAEVAAVNAHILGAVEAHR